MKFTEAQLQRYKRHLILPEVGEQGQTKLLNAKVFMVGAGGLGSPVGYYLSAGGVGTIAIIDNDEVDLSNLQRQIAHCTRTLGIPKVESAKNTFESLNPDVQTWCGGGWWRISRIFAASWSRRLRNKPASRISRALRLVFA